MKSNPEYIVLNRGFYVLSQTQQSQQVDNEVHKRFKHLRRVCKVTVSVVRKGSCVISLVADLHTTKQTNAHTRRGHYRFKTLRTRAAAAVSKCFHCNRNGCAYFSQTPIDYPSTITYVYTDTTQHHQSPSVWWYCIKDQVTVVVMTVSHIRHVRILASTSAVSSLNINQSVCFVYVTMCPRLYH